jgi:hypothetical protein
MLAVAIQQALERYACSLAWCRVRQRLPGKDVGLGDGSTALVSIEAGPQGGYRLRAWAPVCEERGLVCQGGRDGSWRCT